MGRRSRNRRSSTLRRSTKQIKGVKLSKSGIPQIIHQIWLGGPPSPMHALYMSTWMNKPGWTYKLWDTASITQENFPITWPYIKESMRIGKDEWKDIKKKYSPISDLMRIEILYRYGGLYADATLEAAEDFNLGSIFDKYPNTMVIANERPCDFNCYSYWGKYVSCGFVGCIPKHPILTQMLDVNILDAINLNSPYANVETGPYFWGRFITEDAGVLMIESHLIYPFAPGIKDKCYSKKRRVRMNHNITINKKYAIFPCNKYPGAYTIKHWDVGGSWIHPE